MWDAGCAKRGSIKRVFILNNNKNYTNSLKKKYIYINKVFRRNYINKVKIRRKYNQAINY